MEHQKMKFTHISTIPPIYDEEFQKIKINMRELKYAIHLQNPKKAPGYDRIDALLI